MILFTSYNTSFSRLESELYLYPAGHFDVLETVPRRLVPLCSYSVEAPEILVRGPHDSMNASEISFLGKVTRPKTYGAIRGLESKGLLRIVPGKPERYMAVSPNDVLIPLVEKLNRETSECVAVVENLTMAFESSKYVYTEKPFERSDLWSVKGREKVYKRVQDLIGEAKVNVFFATTANGLVRIYKAHSEVLEKASERGAKVRIIAPVNQTNSSVARELNEVIEVRNAT